MKHGMLPQPTLPESRRNGERLLVWLNEAQEINTTAWERLRLLKAIKFHDYIWCRSMQPHRVSLTDWFNQQYMTPSTLFEPRDLRAPKAWAVTEHATYFLLGKWDQSVHLQACVDFVTSRQLAWHDGASWKPYAGQQLLLKQ